MAYVLYDDGFDSHPKVLAVKAADRGALSLHLLCNTWTSRTKTPGIVPLGAVVEQAGGKARGVRWANILVAAELWHGAGHDCDRCQQPAKGDYVIHDYAVPNGPVVERAGRRDELSKTRAEAGRRGAEARWAGRKEAVGTARGRGPADGKPHGKPMATGVANGCGANGNPIATGWQTDAYPDPSSSGELVTPLTGGDAHAYARGGPLAELISQVKALRPFWPPQEVADAARACTDAGRTPAATHAALVAVALDPQTVRPGRVLGDGPWWRPPVERHTRSTTDERVEAGLVLAAELAAAERAVDRRADLRALPGGAA